MSLSVDAMDLSVQSRPDEYEYLLELEQGSSSSAYLGIDRRAGRGARLVVVHMAHPSIARDEGFRAAFGGRVSVSQALSHTNIVRTLDLVADDRWCYWVTEFFPARTLAEVGAKRGRAEKRGTRSEEQRELPRALSVDQYLLILREVLVGLEYAHGLVAASGAPSPVFHRNLCPASVLVGFDGGIKVNDYAFGGAPEVTFGRLEGAATRLAYFAPERCLGRPMDARCDVYAVGGMLWEALTGAPRRSGKNLQEALQIRLRDADAKVEDVRPDVDPALAAIARRALAWEPGQRYQTAREFRLDLDDHLLRNDVRIDHGVLFGFMCNHFCEEYDALERLLESRARALPRAVPPAARVLGGEEPVDGGDGAAHGLPSRELEPMLDASSEPRLSSFVRSGSDDMSGLSARRRRLGLWLIAGGACVAIAYSLLSWTGSTGVSTTGVSPTAVSPTTVSEASEPGTEVASRKAERGTPPAAVSPAVERSEARELSQVQQSLRPQATVEEPQPSAGGEAEANKDGVAEAPLRDTPRARRSALSQRKAASRKRALAEAAASKARAVQAEVQGPTLESEDDRTLSELATTPGLSSGADLRALRPRTARPIDKKDPYSR